VRTSSIEYADRPVNVGDAQRAAFYRDFANQTALGQLGLRTYAHIISHFNSPAIERVTALKLDGNERVYPIVFLSAPSAQEAF
jgi:hypothetical protein